MLAPFVLAIVMAGVVDGTLAPVTVQQPPATPAGQATDKPWPPQGVYTLTSGSGLTAPRLVKEFKPKYTAAAMDANVQGLVSMEVIVQADGTVGDVRVKRSLDTIYGLDDEAVKTVKKWTFTPGTKDGVAVPVMVEIEMTFRKK